MTPSQLGRYRILKRLAAGGMGEVFLARQEGPAGFARPAVIKRVLGHLVEQPGFVELFLAEARLAAVLSHPNVVQIFELGQADDTWFLAMEYLDGRSLRAIRKEVLRKGGRVNPIQAARLVGQALQGLHYAHGAKDEAGRPMQIVHRDVSPDNIFVCFNGAVKVLDFGIAKASTALRVTRTGEVRGKFEYMSPEQLRAEPLDGRTDVFAAGVVLYELLAGERPYGELSEAAAIHHLLNVAPPPLEPRAPQAPPELCRIAMKALEKQPAARWQSADEFSSALEQFIASVGELNNNASTAAWLQAIFPEEERPDPFADAKLATPARIPVKTVPLGPVVKITPPEPESEPELGSKPDPVTEPPPPPWQHAAVPRRVEPPGVPAEPSGSWEIAPVPKRVEPPLPPPAPAPVELPLELSRPDPPAAPLPPELPPSRRRFPVWPVIVIAVMLGAAALFVPRLIPEKRIDIGMLVVDSDPPGATLKISDDVVGKTPWSGSNVWSGDVRYEVSAPGRMPAHGTFHGGGDVTLHAKLSRK